MKRVPIAEFKAHCSQYIEEAASEDIVITKHGKPVARVSAVEEPAPQDVWDFYRSLKGKSRVTSGAPETMLVAAMISSAGSDLKSRR